MAVSGAHFILPSMQAMQIKFDAAVTLGGEGTTPKIDNELIFRLVYLALMKVQRTGRKQLKKMFVATCIMYIWRGYTHGNRFFYYGC